MKRLWLAGSEEGRGRGSCGSSMTGNIDDIQRFEGRRELSKLKEEITRGEEG